jgi:hypothetical protein
VKAGFDTCAEDDVAIRLAPSLNLPGLAAETSIVMAFAMRRRCSTLPVAAFSTKQPRFLFAGYLNSIEGWIVDCQQ